MMGESNHWEGSDVDRDSVAMPHCGDASAGAVGGDLGTSPSCSDADTRTAPASSYKTSLHHS
jgi:hypothetical protein